MTQLRSTIARLADEFAAGVLEAIRSASLEEILAESRGGRAPLKSAPAVRGPSASSRNLGKNGRLGRRSEADIADLLERIVTLLEKHPDGLRAEQIRETLALEARELPRPLAEGLSTKRIAKQGQKRATTYFARPGVRNGGGTPKPAKRGRPAK